MGELDMHIASRPIDYDYEGPPGHLLLRLKPTQPQWDDFSAMFSLARRLNAEEAGCFKVILPNDLRDPLPAKAPLKTSANAYIVKQIETNSQKTFWGVTTVLTNGVISSSAPEARSLSSVEVAMEKLENLFKNTNKEKKKKGSKMKRKIKNTGRRIRGVRYRVDVPVWTAEQRLEASVPERSPIHSLKGDKLDYTKAVIPGIHTPYVYESGPAFGAIFQLHVEDFRLASLNHLHKGRKIWIVIPPTAVEVVEQALGRENKCSQFMRHRAEFFFPEQLEKMGIPYRIVNQRPGETVVILPDAYHEGFSTGYTIAEAKNYAESGWTVGSYQPCQVSCKLATAIPANFMQPLRDGGKRLDLCADYNEEKVDAQQQQPKTQ